MSSFARRCAYVLLRAKCHELTLADYTPHGLEMMCSRSDGTPYVVVTRLIRRPTPDEALKAKQSSSQRVRLEIVTHLSWF